MNKLLGIYEELENMGIEIFACAELDCEWNSTNPSEAKSTIEHVLDAIGCDYNDFDFQEKVAMKVLEMENN